MAQAAIEILFHRDILQLLERVRGQKHIIIKDRGTVFLESFLAVSLKTLVNLVIIKAFFKSPTMKMIDLLELHGGNLSEDPS